MPQCDFGTSWNHDANVIRRTTSSFDASSRHFFDQRLLDLVRASFEHVDLNKRHVDSLLAGDLLSPL
jgi:hypothetical protein